MSMELLVDRLGISNHRSQRTLILLKTRRLLDTFNFSYLLTLVAAISYLSINPSYFSYVRITS